MAITKKTKATRKPKTEEAAAATAIEDSVEAKETPVAEPAPAPAPKATKAAKTPKAAPAKKAAPKHAEVKMSLEDFGIKCIEGRTFKASWKPTLETHCKSRDLPTDLLTIKDLKAVFRAFGITEFKEDVLKDLER